MKVELFFNNTWAILVHCPSHDSNTDWIQSAFKTALNTVQYSCMQYVSTLLIKQFIFNL